MSRPLSHYWTILPALLAAFLAGCNPQQPFFVGDRGDMSHYLGMATDLEEPDLNEAPLPDAHSAKAPLTLAHPNFDNPWDLSLEEAVQTALQNSKVVRRVNQLLGPGFQINNPGVSPSQLRSAPDSVATIYDPALQSSNPGAIPHGITPASLMGLTGLTLPQQGVEGALAEFDSQFSTSFFWDRGDSVQNRPLGNQIFPPFLTTNRAEFDMEIAKKSAVGTNFAVRNRSIYTENDPPVFRNLPSDWYTAMEVEARQPLARGFGTAVNRVPVVLARIREDVSLAEFESNVRNLVMDVEQSYWRLYLAYRVLEASRKGRDEALRLWRTFPPENENPQQALGGIRPSYDEARARQQYFAFRSQMEQALIDLHKNETRLRYLMGLSATDGRLIRPVDEPITAKVNFEWADILGESLYRSPELRRQKWQIKRRETEMIAAQNQLLPQFDAVALYRWLGLGDHLFGAEGNQPRAPQVGSSAINELASGDFQEWRLGAELSMPIGFRRELAGVRHHQLLLAREKARMEDMELEVTHQLSDAIKDLDGNYILSQTHYNRYVAATKEVEALEAIRDAGANLIDGQNPLDRLLDAQRRQFEAETAYFTALSNYTLSISYVHFSKNSILEANNIMLAEGPWPGKAYFDAERLARQRGASPTHRYGATYPGVISRGPVDQGSSHMMEGAEEIPEGRKEMAPESEPTPASTAPPTIGLPANREERAAQSSRKPTKLTAPAMPSDINLQQPITKP